IPAIGIGTWALRRNTSEVIAMAIQNGFRHIDAAWIYNNQRDVGLGIKEGLRRTGMKREDIWVTSKLWNDRHADKVSQGLEETLQQLGLDYLDLWLVHFPV
ncbi:Aldo/keto reductase, partial [Trichodelitschia bisporula]